jgi:hypothetical protein
MLTYAGMAAQVRAPLHAAILQMFERNHLTQAARRELRRFFELLYQ